MGGGRPGDTDYPTVSSLEVRAFKLWAGLSGLVPRIAVVKGRCFAGNAVIAGAADLIVATADTSIGMGGPAILARPEGRRCCQVRSRLNLKSSVSKSGVCVVCA